MTATRDAALRWLYRGGRPNRLARWLNGLGAWHFATGVLSPRRAATLQVRGRRSGKPIDLPVVVTDLGGERYLVAMLGERAQWVRNVRAAGGEAVLRRGGSEPVRLEEVPVAGRPPIRKRYLDQAPGARPHIAVDRHAPVAAFEPIAADHPVFRVVPRDGVRPGRAAG